MEIGLGSSDVVCGFRLFGIDKKAIHLKHVGPPHM